MHAEENQSFRIVKMLADDLSSGNLELAYLPDIAVRIRRTLQDPECSLDRVVKVVGTEPGLAARVLKMSNSALFARGGKSATEVRTAVNRLGFDAVRNAAFSYALGQIRQAPDLKPLATELKAAWLDGVEVAATSFVIAQTYTDVNPDEALLAGLVHNIGRVYILTRSREMIDAELWASELSDIMGEWSPAIGRSICEGWEMPEQITAAVANQGDMDREAAGPVELTDVLALAVYLAAHRWDEEEPDISELPWTRRIGISVRWKSVV